MRRKITQLGISILVVLIASLPVFAQSDVSTATIKGSVTDPNNAVVAGATVTATSPRARQQAICSNRIRRRLCDSDSAAWPLRDSHRGGRI